MARPVRETPGGHPRRRATSNGCPPRTTGGKPVKQPYYIHPASGLLSFAGLYELWADPAKDEDDPGRWLWSAAIITHHATWLAGVMNDPTATLPPPNRI